MLAIPPPSQKYATELKFSGNVANVQSGTHFDFELGALYVVLFYKASKGSYARGLAICTDIANGVQVQGSHDLNGSGSVHSYRLLMTGSNLSVQEIVNGSLNYNTCNIYEVHKVTLEGAK